MICGFAYVNDAHLGAKIQGVTKTSRKFNFKFKEMSLLYGESFINAVLLYRNADKTVT